MFYKDAALKAHTIMRPNKFYVITGGRIDKKDPDEGRTSSP